MSRGGVIIAFEQGKLGNQLFQYPAMRMFAPEAIIITFGMDDLVQGFDGVSLSRLSLPMKGGRGWRWQIKAGFLTWTTRAMVALRLFSVVNEEEGPDGPHFRMRTGLFRRIWFFRSGFYQFEDVADSPAGMVIRLKRHFTEVAERTLSALPGRPCDRYFVHVRRGDYIWWPSRDHPAVLPFAWYRQQMSRIRERNPNAVFVVTSDDRPYVEEFFAGLPAVFVVHLGVLEDFAVMAGCLGGGILSASTFAWWAGCLARRANPAAAFVAPRYWVGHGTRAWMPPGIQTSWIEYVDA